MMEDKVDGSSNFKVLEIQDFRGIIILGNTKGFTRESYQ
jgi:hypothetical protein